MKKQTHRKSKRTQQQSVVAVREPPLLPPFSIRRPSNILILILTLFLFVVLEIVLRHFNYGGNFDPLVLKGTIQGKEFYSLNPEISKRYFFGMELGMPEPYEDMFEVNKSPNTYRIFCLGESTMYGYPYPENATAPRFLKELLTKMFPEKKIEVINLGIPAVSSAVVADLIKEVMAYQPDLLIIYSGHNEFYGTYGVASTQYISQTRAVVQVTMQLRRLRVYCLIRDAIASLRAVFSSNKPEGRSTFMAQMAQDKYIAYGSETYNRAKRNYRENLNAVIQISRQHRIPVMISSLVSNLKDLPPLTSIFSSSTSEDGKRRWQALFDVAVQEQDKANFTRAIELLSSANQIDSMRADAHFHLARCLEQIGEYDKAKREYIAAENFDALRFRVGPEFSDIVRDLCRQYNIPMLDLERAFTAHSPNGIMGKELITEHLHPNIGGYLLMAEQSCRDMATNDLLAPKDQWKLLNDTLTTDYRGISSVTDLDAEIGNIRVEILKSAWPFKENPSGVYHFDPKTFVQQAAFDYCEKNITWEEAHYRMGKYYTDSRQFDLALKEYNTVATARPYSYYPQMMRGDVLVLLGKYPEAEQSYWQAMTLNENQFVHLRMGILLVQLQKFDDAIQHLGKALALDETASTKFNQELKLKTMYVRSVAYWSKGDVVAAKDELQRVLAIRPDHHEAEMFLEHLQRQYQQR